MFVHGFKKVADEAKNEHDRRGALRDALIGVTPLGTTADTMFSKRPEGHSRTREWLGRTVAATAGSAGGMALGRRAVFGIARKSQNPFAVLLAGQLGGGLIGQLVGEYLAAKKIRSGQQEKY